jgi:folate-dependent phosphoribosylglycinamide formyltransferase PurN
LSSIYRLGWFSTGRGEGSKGLLRTVQEAIRSGELKAKLEFVFCSREHGETAATDQYLKMVTDYGVPLVAFSYQKYRAMRGMPNPDPNQPLPQWRLDYDREVMKRLEPFQPNLCVLAGFMLITGPEMCWRYDIINLHPAAPDGPAGTWQEVIWKLMESQATHSGVKMHVAIPELDAGPTATYCTFSIRGQAFDKYRDEIRDKSIAEIRKTQGENNALFKAIRQHGYARELPLIIATIRAFGQGKVRITADEKVVDAGGHPISGYDLTAEIDRLVKDILPG